MLDFTFTEFMEHQLAYTNFHWEFCYDLVTLDLYVHGESDMYQLNIQ